MRFLTSKLFFLRTSWRLKLSWNSLKFSWNPMSKYQASSWNNLKFSCNLMSKHQTGSWTIWKSAEIRWASTKQVAEHFELQTWSPIFFPNFSPVAVLNNTSKHNNNNNSNNNNNTNNLLILWLLLLLLLLWLWLWLWLW